MSDSRDELRWMGEKGWKREIEAVCDAFEGGLVGYLTWKISEVFGTKYTAEDEGIQWDELEDSAAWTEIIDMDISDIDDIEGIWC